MYELAANFTALRLGRRHVGYGDEIPDEVPFCPSGKLTAKLNNTPRYLFLAHQWVSMVEEWWAETSQI
jgi:hypothetical protein